MAAVDVADRSLPLGRVSARRAVAIAGAGIALVAGLVLLLPAVGDLPDIWRRLAHGSPWWLGLALVLEALSFAGHAVLFRAVSRGGSGARIGMRASTEITLAGHVATRLVSSGGAGGVALTAWALRRSGMDARDVAARMTTFLVLLYSVYMAALVIGGLGLATGLVPGGGSVAITVVPAVFGAAVIAAALALQRVRPGEGRLRRWLAPVGAGVRDARALVRSGNLGLLGALMWWGFDIATLWASFQAFGTPPALGVLVVAYFVGSFANLLPLPGGVGGIDGGLVGALAAFGTDPALAIVAVLAYRFFSFWLPIAPGAVAFASLRRTVAGWSEPEAEAEAAAARPDPAPRRAHPRPRVAEPALSCAR